MGPCGSDRLQDGFLCLSLNQMGKNCRVSKQRLL